MIKMFVTLALGAVFIIFSVWLYLVIVMILGSKLRYFLETKVLGNDLPPFEPFRFPFRRK